MVEDSEQEKKEVGFVDDKMIEIKGNIDDLIQQSNELKTKNLALEKKIGGLNWSKDKINKFFNNAFNVLWGIIYLLILFHCLETLLFLQNQVVLSLSKRHTKTTR